MTEQMTRKIGSKTVVLTLDRIDSKSGNQLWRGDNGRNYIKVAATGRLVRATISA